MYCIFFRVPLRHNVYVVAELMNVAGAAYLNRTRGAGGGERVCAAFDETAPDAHTSCTRAGTGVTNLFAMRTIFFNNDNHNAFLLAHGPVLISVRMCRYYYYIVRTFYALMCLPRWPSFLNENIYVYRRRAYGDGEEKNKKITHTYIYIL